MKRILQELGFNHVDPIKLTIHYSNMKSNFDLRSKSSLKSLSNFSSRYFALSRWAITAFQMQAVEFWLFKWLGRLQPFISTRFCSALGKRIVTNTTDSPSRDERSFSENFDIQDPVEEPVNSHSNWPQSNIYWQLNALII